MSEETFGGARVRLVIRVACAFAAFVAWPCVASASRRVTAAPCGAAQVAIDGRLDETVWRRARPSGEFVERAPAEGAPAPVATTFRVLFDEDALYVAVTCATERGETPRGLELRRDGPRIADDDAVVVKLDVHRDRRTTLAFGVNVAGATIDYLATDNGAQQRLEVDALWEAATARTRDGWTAEIRLPYAALGLGAGGGERVLGLNVTRMHAARAATYDWSPMPQSQGGLAAAHYGELRGLRAAASGRPITFAPHVRVGWTDRGARDSARGALVGDGDPWSASAGLDVRMRLADDTWSEATLLTDFSDADLDPSVVNMGRFPLFQPERRTFFLTGLEIFDFGSSGEIQPFFSRRIGLDEDGRPITVLGGAKLHGHAGAVSFGLLETTTLDPDEHFVVGRVRVAATDDFRVGAIAVSRWQPDAARPHVSGGADVALDAASGRLELRGYGAATRSSDEDARTGAAAGLSARWRGDVSPSVSSTWVDPHFDPEAGFVRRTGTMRTRASLPGTLTPSSGALESMRLSIDASIETTQTLSRRLGRSIGGGVDLYARNGLGFGAYAGVEDERVDEAFELLDGLVVEPGTYGGPYGGVGVGLASRLNPSGQIVYEVSGAFYGGVSHRVRAETTLVAGPHLRGTLSGTLGYVDLPQERGAWTWTGDATIAIVPSTRLVTDLVLRANGVEERAVGMARIRWRLAAGSELLALYRVGYSWDSPHAVERAVTLSLTYRMDAIL